MCLCASYVFLYAMLYSIFCDCKRKTRTAQKMVIYVYGYLFLWGNNKIWTARLQTGNIWCVYTRDVLIFFMISFYFILILCDGQERERERWEKMVNSQKIFYALAMSLYSIDIKYVTQIRLGRLLPEWKKRKFLISHGVAKKYRIKWKSGKGRRVKRCGTSNLLSFIESTSLCWESIYNNNKNHNRIIEMKLGL